jgi:hypothetical protein
LFADQVLDERPKRITALSFILYFPFISVLVGAPIPFPSLLEVTSEQIAIFNFISLLITIIGSIIGVGFYLERRSNLKLEKQNTEIEKIDDSIGEATIAVRQEIKELHMEMKEMETRICSLLADKSLEVSKHAALEVATAKEVADTRFRNIEGNQQIMRRSIQNLELGYKKSTKYSSHIDVEDLDQDEEER